MKILVIELSNLGDAILTTPALQGLWDCFPGAEFHILASARTRGLFESDPRVKRVWIWQKHRLFRQISIIGQLFRMRFDLVVDFRHSLIPLFLGSRRRTPLIRRRTHGIKHRTESHLALLDTLGIPRYADPAPLGYSEEEQRTVEQWLDSHPLRVAIAPGSRSHLKRWAADRFASVADRLVQEEHAQILLVGDTEDCGVAKNVHALMKQPAVDLTGRTTIRQLAALLSQVDLVVTNDSACLHAAEAMQTPTVAIFGPTDERKYGPRNPRSVVVRRKLVCAPCERALCPYDHECMRWLEVSEVYEAVVKVLQGSIR